MLVGGRLRNILTFLGGGCVRSLVVEKKLRCLERVAQAAAAVPEMVDEPEVDYTTPAPGPRT